jgi:hydrophobe/amphiphile efflux-1 (HAE1) family protein
VLSNFFIARPIFSLVIAIVITLAGSLAIPLLPISQYPQIVPPTVQVSASYTGGNAEVVEKSVTMPLEEQINGVEGMTYLSSTSSDDGSMSITVTFDVGYDVDVAATDVLNWTQIAEAQLPDEVQREGVTVSKQVPFVTLCLELISPGERFDQLYINNYATIHIIDVLHRIRGVGSVQLFGGSGYAMRVWLDPDKLASLGLSAQDVTRAIEAQNQDVAAGAIGQPPAPSGQRFRYAITTLGRLSDPAQFADIVVRTQPDGAIVRIKDVGRVELGAQDYSTTSRFNGRAGANMCVFEVPGGNSIDLVSQVRSEMERLSKDFPAGLEYRIVYDTTRFVRASIREVVITLFEAMGLVFLVIYVFLQEWRATLIPAITIPVSLVGAFALMKVFGFSINTLTLFGLVLAVGLVVDDAIVVVENVSRIMKEKALSAREAARIAMSEVTGPIVATSLVLMAVFVPIAFTPGVTGQLYRQFAITIACAVGISAINALSLSPALSAVLLTPGGERKGGFFRLFNHGLARATLACEQGVKHLSRAWYLVLLVFALLIALTIYLFRVVPTSFVPVEDQGYLLVAVQLPEGASLERTEEVARRIETILQAIPGVENILTFDGVSLIEGTNATNLASVIPILAPWSERTAAAEQADAIAAAARRQLADIKEAQVTVIQPPTIHGLSQAGGFQFELQDQSGGHLSRLASLSQEVVRRGNERPELAGLFTTFRADTPQLYIEIDRTKAMTEGLSISQVFDMLQTYLGVVYVNQFNKFGRVYRVYVQAEGDSRATEQDIGRLYLRNDQGEMVPLSAFIRVKPVVGARTIPHYNLYRSAAINGEAAPGYSSNQAMQAMESLADEILPTGYGYEWTGIAYQQRKAGALAPAIFALALVFVFLFLAAQDESWTMPLMVMLVVPLAMLGAIGAQWIRGLDNDVYAQIGFVLLIGLASKNAILIVEFARRRREEGLTIEEAAMEATRLRLRPILMTAFAFILGVLPLVVATGAGSAARHSLGTAVFGGMLAATLLSIFLVPVLYVLIERLRERTLKAEGVAHAPGEPLDDRRKPS